MKKNLLHKLTAGFILIGFMLISGLNLNAQTNVFDDVIAVSPDHTYLKAALEQEGLDVALRDANATLTVFAPTDVAIANLADALGTDIAGILALPNLTDVLTYHVVGAEVMAADITNGDVVDALSATNTLKITKTSTGNVFVNQAAVSTADVTADNGVVHVLDAVVLPSETVVDVALDNGFSTLATAVITAELLPALTDPLAKFTVFAPTNAAFDDLAAALGTDLDGILALPNLADVLTYHVLGAEVMAADITNGDVVDALSATNTLKITKTSTGNVYVNQAAVSTADVAADNGVVHILDAVVLPSETVVDVALDNGFSTLATAVIIAELLPALTDPLAKFTVFAPTNAAFEKIASDLGTDLEGVLALENLSDILLYHVVGGETASSELVAGDIVTLNGTPITIDLSNGVQVNGQNVTTADVMSENGIVHIIDGVLVPMQTVTKEIETGAILDAFPNPAEDIIYINGYLNSLYQIMDFKGSLVMEGVLSNDRIIISDLSSGKYILRVISDSTIDQGKFIKI